MGFSLTCQGCSPPPNELDSLYDFINNPSLSSSSGVSSTTSTQTAENNNFILPDIDLTHWKVTLPVGNPTSVRPPEILNYADMIFLLIRKDIDAQIDSYYELLGKELDKDEIIRATLDMESAVETHPNHRILYYEDMVNFLSRREDERF